MSLFCAYLSIYYAYANAIYKRGSNVNLFFLLLTLSFFIVIIFYAYAYSLLLLLNFRTQPFYTILLL